MLRTLRVALLLRSCTRRSSLKVASAGLPVSSHQVDQNSPKLKDLMEKAVRQKPIYMRPLQNIIRNLSPRPDEQACEDLLMVLDVLGSLARTYDRADYLQILNRFWDSRNPNTITIHHYNAYFRARTRIGLEVNMEKYLEEIAQHGLNPDAVTFQRFVENFCDNGNIDRAVEVVRELEAEAKTREIYHALIKGFSRARNPNGARELLSQMEAQSIEPNSETYTVLACGLAECGEHAEVLRIVETGNLSASQLLCVLQSTSDIDLIDKLCARISTLDWSIWEAQKCCAELVHAGKLKEACMVVDRLLTDTEQDLDFFSSQMVESKYSAEQVVEFCRRIKYETTRQGAIRAAAYTAILSADPLAALEYLSALRGEGFQIREHYFYPLICRAQAETAACAVVQQMHDWEVPATEAALKFLFAKLIDQWLYGALTALARVEQLTLPENLAKRGLAHYYIKEEGLERCLQVFDILDASIWEQFVPLIAEATTFQNEVSALLLIEKISEKLENRRHDLKQEYERHLSGELAEKISPKLANSAVLTYSQPPNTWLIKRKRNSAKGLSSLTFLCGGDDSDARNDNLKVLNEDSSDKSALFNLISLHRRNNDLDRTMYYFNRLREEPDAEITDWMITTMITFMIERKHYDDALALAKEHRFRGDFKSVSSKTAKISALVKVSLEHAGLDATLEVISVVIPECLPILPHALTAVIDHALEHEPERVIEIFKEFDKSYKVCVGVMQIYRRLISERKEEDLIAVHKIAARRYEPEAANMFLAIAFINEGRTPRARGIIKRLRMNKARLYQIKSWFEGMLEKDLISDLELAFQTVVECGIYYEPLFLILADAFEKKGDVEKANRLWLTSCKYKVELSLLTRSAIRRTFEAGGKNPPFDVKQ